MTTGLSLSGIRTRDGRMVRINAILLARENENCWRARILPAEIVQVGDRLRFGDTSGSPACFLAFLDADIIEGNGDDALLSFHFTGTALEEALDRLGDTPVGEGRSRREGTCPLISQSPEFPTHEE
jgi:S-adenosylmethionine:tRNA ribosyltransferase-isomerase